MKYFIDIFMTQLPLEVYRIDIKYIRNLHNMDTRRKKELLIKELEWCNEHISDLANTVNALYQFNSF